MEKERSLLPVVEPSDSGLVEGLSGHAVYLPGFRFEPVSGRLRQAGGEVTLRPKSAACCPS